MGGLDHVPDVRDGLTHVERRLLHALGAPKTERRKSRVVIDAARYRTDYSRSEMYDALVRLAQGWSSRYPLVSGQGNFGSIDDDPPASSIYTEVRLARRTDRLFGAGDARVTPDAKRPTVDFGAALTGPYPNLLANGASDGLASFPPHLLDEAVAGVIARLDNPSASLDDVLAVMPGPDYPTGGELVDRDEIRAVYETGAGSIRLRGVAHIEIDDADVRAEAVRQWEQDNPVPEGQQVWAEPALEASQRIVVTEIPFDTKKGGEDGLIRQTVEQIHDGPLRGISDVYDQTDRNGMRLTFDVRDEADPLAVRELLFELTSLESAIPILMVALVDGKPEQLTLLEVIDRYLDHQRAVRTGSRDEIDEAIRRDLESLTHKETGQRRTRLPD